MNFCPVSSEQILNTAIDALREKKGFVCDNARNLAGQMQEYWFLDVYLDIEGGSCTAFRLGTEDDELKKTDYSESFMCGVPFTDHEGNSREWLVKIEIADSEDTSTVHITDRCLPYLDMNLKPSRGYQWHITDDCDQRCKHCYLHAEDARKNCVTTPWEQLVKTLEQIEEDAAYNYVFPLLAISGGDPILHPDFWQLAELIHGVDSVKLAKEIGKQSVKTGTVSNILLEVNIGNEESKFGFKPGELLSAVSEIASIEGIRVRGLMTSAPICENPEENRVFFRNMKQLSIDIKKQKTDNVYMDFLSMGMSGDYESAIGEGATFVRVGTAIFGERDYSSR